MRWIALLLIAGIVQAQDSVKGDGVRLVIRNDTLYLTMDTLAIPRDSTDYTLPWIPDTSGLDLDSTQISYIPSVAGWNALLRRIERLEKRVETEIWRTSYVAILDTTLHSSWFDRVKALEKRLDLLEKNCLKLDTTSWKYQPDYLDKDSSIWLEDGIIYIR